MAEENPATQRKTAVTAQSKFVFARRSVCQYSMAEEKLAAQRQTAVKTYFASTQLLLFVFVWRSECCSSRGNSSQLMLFVFELDGRKLWEKVTAELSVHELQVTNFSTQSLAIQDMVLCYSCFVICSWHDDMLMT